MSVIHLNSDNFENEVLRSEKPVLVDFYAYWCGPCKMIAPFIEELASEHSEYVFAKVNVDNNMPLAFSYGVESIPLILIFKNGEVVKKSVGYKQKDDILKLLAE